MVSIVHNIPRCIPNSISLANAHVSWYNPLWNILHTNSHWENCHRALVWTIYLNDIPEGEGETEFLYDKIRIQPRQGMGCLFPSAWMYQHRGNPVHSHTKYIATGWYWYPQEPYFT